MCLVYASHLLTMPHALREKPPPKLVAGARADFHQQGSLSGLEGEMRRIRSLSGLLVFSSCHFSSDAVVVGAGLRWEACIQLLMPSTFTAVGVVSKTM